MNSLFFDSVQSGLPNHMNRRSVYLIFSSVLLYGTYSPDFLGSYFYETGSLYTRKNQIQLWVRTGIHFDTVLVVLQVSYILGLRCKRGDK